MAHRTRLPAPAAAVAALLLAAAYARAQEPPPASPQAQPPRPAAELPKPAAATPPRQAQPEPSRAATTAPPGPAAPAKGAAPEGQEAILLTVFFRHDQSRPLGELNAQLARSGFYARFPPPGVEVVSWYVMMGVGQVVTLRVPPSKLRDVNLVVENGAWGAFRTEFYPTYDYRPMWEEQRRGRR